jgi:hypothetical protein
MRRIDPPSRVSGVDAKDEVERLFRSASSAIAARTGSASSRRFIGPGMLWRPFGAAGGGRRVGRRVAGGKGFFQLLVELLFRLRL